MFRAVVDTNILLRAVIKPGGTVGPVITRLRNSDYVLIYSQSLIDELLAKLALPRIREKCSLKQPLARQAEVVVTGDEDLLTLKKFEAVRFVTARAFLELLDQAPQASK